MEGGGDGWKALGADGADGDDAPPVEGHTYVSVTSSLFLSLLELFNPSCIANVGEPRMNTQRVGFVTQTLHKEHSHSTQRA